MHPSPPIAAPGRSDPGRRSAPGPALLRRFPGSRWRGGTRSFHPRRRSGARHSRERPSYRSYQWFSEMFWYRCAAERFPAQFEDLPFGLGDRREDTIAHHLDRLAALARQAGEQPLAPRRLDDKDVAAAGFEIAGPPHAMQQLLQLIAVRAARPATKFLDEIEARRVDLPMGGFGVIDQHGGLLRQPADPPLPHLGTRTGDPFVVG